MVVISLHKNIFINGMLFIDQNFWARLISQFNMLKLQWHLSHSEACQTIKPAYPPFFPSG